MAALAETMDQAVKVMGEREGKYLTFTLAEEEYGIGILKIKEIIGMMPITSVPQTPAFVTQVRGHKKISVQYQQVACYKIRFLTLQIEPATR